MKTENLNISEGEFRLKDIVYPVTSAVLSASYHDMELVIFPQVDAETEDKNVEYEMRSVYLYHNNGFNTHCGTFEELKGKTFVWASEVNEDDEEAGTLCVQEHEEVQNGAIEILEVASENMLIRWSGEAVVGWDDEYGDHVPFDTLFAVKIPSKVPYVLDASKSEEMKIDKGTKLVLLNLEKFNEELKQMPSSGFWGEHVLELTFHLIEKENDYEGKIIFEKAKNAYRTVLDEHCPRRIVFQGLDYNLRVNYEMFYFHIEYGGDHEY